MSRKSAIATHLVLLATVLAGSSVVPSARAQSAADKAPASPASAKPAARAPSRYRPNRFAGRAGTYYRLVWGVDALAVKWSEQGEVIKFTYKVVDPEKAKPLNDKKAEPVLLDAQAGVKLVVPSLEKIGQLRQTSTPEEGRVYWMAFSNKGRHVKQGDHVSVVIGKFRADGLLVD
jgi:hypothetical protein